jgi:hypothetical protein
MKGQHGQKCTLISSSGHSLEDSFEREGEGANRSLQQSPRPEIIAAGVGGRGQIQGWTLRK